MTHKKTGHFKFLQTPANITTEQFSLPPPYRMTHEDDKN